MNDPRIELCRSLPGATEDVKWGNDLVFSVGGKMFAAFDLPDAARPSFKVDPETFAVLVQQPGIRPAPYLARHSWVSLESRDALPEDAVLELLEASYELVVRKLPKKVRASLARTSNSGS